jgi:hypothetical protein
VLWCGVLCSAVLWCAVGGCNLLFCSLQILLLTFCGMSLIDVSKSRFDSEMHLIVPSSRTYHWNKYHLHFVTLTDFISL